MHTIRPMYNRQGAFCSIGYVDCYQQIWIVVLVSGVSKRAFRAAEHLIVALELIDMYSLVNCCLLNI